MEPTPDLDFSDAAPNQRNGTLHRTSPRKKVRFPALPASLVAIALGGFALWQGHAGKDSATTSTTPAAAPVAVTVQKVSPQRLRFWNDFSGRLRAVESWGVPKIRALAEATYFAGLRKAGIPEK